MAARSDQSFPGSIQSSPIASSAQQMTHGPQSLHESMIWMMSQMQAAVVAHEERHRRDDEERRREDEKRETRRKRWWAAVTFITTTLGPMSAWCIAGGWMKHEERVEPPTEVARDEWVTVQRGDNVCKIAERYGRDAGLIVQYNGLPLVRRHGVLNAPCVPGQKLRMPAHGRRGSLRIVCG